MIKGFKLTILFIIFFSCKKEEVEFSKLVLPATYNYSRSEFVGKTECYDTLFHKTEFIYPYEKNNFLFHDGSGYPYEQIIIKEDGSTSYCYTLREVKYAYQGNVVDYKDTLYFNITHWTTTELNFRAFLNDSELIIPSYGFILKFENSRFYVHYNKFGYPDLIKIKEDYIDRASPVDQLFIQKFNLIYTIQPQ